MYYKPTNIDEALELISREQNATFFAGGTDLMVEYFESLSQMGKIINISGIEELRGITKKEDEIQIGPLTTHQEICDSEILLELVPWLCQAAEEVGSPQIRHRGTIGGNIANASPAADTVPALIAAGATVELTGVNGKRNFDLENIFTGPGETIIDDQELITNISLPIPDDTKAGSFMKIGKRKALSISVLNGSVFLEIDREDMKFIDVRICLGSVAPVPYRARKAEEVIRGAEVTIENIEKAGQAASDEITPIDDVRGTAEYRKQVAKSAVIRLIKEATEQLEVGI